jgi:hypothetical protein
VTTWKGVLTTSMKHIHSTAMAAAKLAVERDRQIHEDVHERDAHLARCASHMPVGSGYHYCTTALYHGAGEAFDHRAMIDLYEPDQLFSPQALGPKVPPILGVAFAGALLPDEGGTG